MGADFFAPWGDELTGGGTKTIRVWLGCDSAVDTSSSWYTGGKVAGIVHGIALSVVDGVVAIGGILKNGGTVASGLLAAGRMVDDAPTKGGVYYLLDPITEAIRYVGRTCDFDRRMIEQSRVLKGLLFKRVHETDSYVEQRIFEMVYFLKAKSLGADLINKIRPIALKHPLFKFVLQHI
jgi:hypothetical protein